MKTVAAAVLLLLAALPLFGASSCEEKADEDSTPLSTVALGEPVAIPADGWTLTTTAASRALALGSRKPLGTFVVVDLTITNTGTMKQALCGNRFKLLDDLGRTYSHDEPATTEVGRKQFCQDINPGLTGAARIAFDVPKDATGLTLRGVGGYRVTVP